MILAAALLVLVGAGLFVAGLLTGTSAFYWACVAACVVAAVLLFGARRKLPDGASAPSDREAGAPPTEAAERPAVERPSATEVAVPAAAPEASGATAVAAAPPAAAVEEEQGDPPVEEVEVTDLLLVVDLDDEVLVVDEHPRYHVAGCAWLGSRATLPLPLDEARTDGFTPCAVCRPDATLADRVRAKRATPGAE